MERTGTNGGRRPYTPTHSLGGGLVVGGRGGSWCDGIEHGMVHVAIRMFFASAFRFPDQSRSQPAGASPCGGGSGRVIQGFAVVMAQVRRPVPFRTRKLRPGTVMVLHPEGCGRVARRRNLLRRIPGRAERLPGISRIRAQVPGGCRPDGTRLPTMNEWAARVFPRGPCRI